MKKRTVVCELEEYDAPSNLPAYEADLLSNAITARKNSYAPYSKFNVGAAVLLEGGEVVLGNNQENACYPSGLCAERVALYAAAANYPGKRILGIAISAASQLHKVNRPVGPCGNCRQSIMEYEVKQQTPIFLIMQGAEGAILKSNSLQNIMPISFDDSFLGDY